MTLVAQPAAVDDGAYIALRIEGQAAS